MNRNIGIIPGLTIEYKSDLSIMAKRVLMTSGQNLLPQLIPGNSVGTIWEENHDIAEIKRNPTKSNWYVFLKKNGWSDYGENLVKTPNPSWEEVYAMVKTFTGKVISYDYPITKDSFCRTGFLCFPKAMDNILKAGYLDSLIQWESLNSLALQATLDYPDHYDDYNSNMNAYYWEGHLDRNGILKGKLQLHKSETETYSK